MRGVCQGLVSGSVVAVSGLMALAGSAWGQVPAKVVVSSIATSPTSLVPGGGGTRFTNFRRPYPSPDGTKWIMVSGTAGTSSTNMVILGAGQVVSSAILPAANTPWNTAFQFGTGFVRNCGINNAGQWAVAGNDTSGTTTDALIAKYDGASLVLHAKEGSTSFGTLGASGITFGGTFDSVGIDQNGLVSFYSSLAHPTPGTVTSANDTAMWYGTSAFVREGSAVLSGQALMEANTLGTIRTNRYYRSNDGLTYINGAQLNSDTSRDAIIFVNGAVVLQEGQTVLSGYTDPVGNTSAGLAETNMAPNGDWFARGNNLNSTTPPSAYWIMRNNQLVAKEGDSITPCSGAGGTPEIWTRRASTPAIYFTSIGNNVGDYVLGGVSDIADENFSGVLVLNGRRIVMRSNDPVDLDGNGLADDDTFIRNYFFDDAFIGPPDINGDRGLYVICNLKNGAGTTTGKALIYKNITGACIADVNSSGNVDADDLFLFLDRWFEGNGSTGTCLPADVNGSDSVDADDLFYFLDAWFAVNGTNCG